MATHSIIWTGDPRKWTHDVFAARHIPTEKVNVVLRFEDHDIHLIVEPDAVRDLIARLSDIVEVLEGIPGPKLTKLLTEPTVFDENWEWG